MVRRSHFWNNNTTALIEPVQIQGAHRKTACPLRLMGNLKRLHHSSQLLRWVKRCFSAAGVLLYSSLLLALNFNSAFCCCSRGVLPSKDLHPLFYFRVVVFSFVGICIEGISSWFTDSVKISLTDEEFMLNMNETIVHLEPEIHMLRDVTLDADTNRKWPIYRLKQILHGPAKVARCLLRSSTVNAIRARHDYKSLSRGRFTSLRKE